MPDRVTNMEKLGIVAFSKPKFDNFLKKHPELIERVRKIMRKYDKKWLDRFAVRQNGDGAKNRVLAI